MVGLHPTCSISLILQSIIGGETKKGRHVGRSDETSGLRGEMRFRVVITRAEPAPTRVVVAGTAQRGSPDSIDTVVNIVVDTDGGLGTPGLRNSVLFGKFLC